MQSAKNMFYMIRLSGHSDEGLKNFFKNPSKILQFKEKKSLIFEFFPKNYTDFSQKDTKFVEKLQFDTQFFSVIPLWMNENLFIIDSDNVFSFNYFKNLLENLGIKTLITKSKFGGHFYFSTKKLGYNLKINSINPPISELHQYKTKAEQALNVKKLKVDFFHSGMKRLLFDGALDNLYYQIDTNYPIAEIPQSLIHKLEALSEIEFTDDFNNSITSRVKSPYVAPNQNKYEMIKKWITPIRDSNGKIIKEGHIDEFEFLSLYNNRYASREKTANLPPLESLPIYDGQQRRNRLISIFGWAASCGYFQDAQELESFIELFYEEYIENKENLPFSEIKKTILNKRRLQNEVMYRDQTEIYVENMKDLKKPLISIVSELHNKDIIFAINQGSSSSEVIKIWKAPDLSEYKISSYTAKNRIIQEMMRSPSSKEEYLKLVEGEYQINYKNLPEITLVRNVARRNELFYINNEESICFNMSYFDLNPKISNLLIKEEPTLEELKQIEESYLQTAFHKIVSQNILPIPEVYYKVIGDWGTWLRKPQYMQNMCIIKDTNGGAGKSFILSNYLKYISFGINDNHEIDLSQNILYHKRLGKGLHTISLNEMVRYLEGFNAPFGDNLIFITEEDAGKNESTKKVNELFNKVIRTSILNVERKGQDVVTMENQTFHIRYTNTYEKVLSDESSNTRYYAVDCDHVWNLKNKEHLNELFGVSFIDEKILKEHIKKEEEIILKYLLFIAPFHDKYIGFVNMPEHIPLSETNEYNAQKVEEVIKDQSIDPVDLGKRIINEFVTDQGEIIKENIIKHYNSKELVLREFARIFNDAYFLFIDPPDERYKGMRLRPADFMRIIKLNTSLLYNSFQEKKIKRFVQYLFRLSSPFGRINKKDLRVVEQNELQKDWQDLDKTSQLAKNKENQLNYKE